MSKILYTDLFEYSTDQLAQEAWVSDAGDELPSEEYSSDSYTKLLLHCNGIDESTTFTDDGDTVHTITAQGNAQVDTAQKVFGTGSLLTALVTDYLEIADHADWNFGAGDFTIDFRVRTNSFSADDMMYNQRVDDGNRIEVFMRSNEIQFRVRSGDVTIISVTQSYSFSINTWYHIALVRNGNNWSFYVDGVSLGTASNSSSVPDLSAVVRIGGDPVNIKYHDGWIDEFRVSKGIARWTSNFDVPDLQCYSEDTIKQQGSYSLKINAKQTDSLNKTLTKTLTDYLDYSIMDVLKFNVRASRTGSNIKLKIYDIGGTTSEYTINIVSADTWQTESWDISGITVTDRDTINKIIIEIVNADNDNIIYIDNLFSKIIVETVHTWIG